MRFLLRSLVFWALSLPIFYVWGLPWLLTKLDAKAQAQSYTACLAHLQKEHLLGGTASVLKQTEGETYCHCVSDDLRFIAADLPELIQKQTPARIVAAQKTVSATCNAQLQGVIDGALSAAPAPTIERDEQGREVIHIR